MGLFVSLLVISEKQLTSGQTWRSGSFACSVFSQSSFSSLVTFGLHLESFFRFCMEMKCVIVKLLRPTVLDLKFDPAH